MQQLLTYPHALLLLVFLPLAGALFIGIASEQEAKTTNTQWLSLWFSTLTFLVSLYLYSGFDATLATPQFTLAYQPSSMWKGIVYQIGLDGLSMPFVLLITFLMPLCILAGWKSITKHTKEYAICLLILESLMLLVFVAQDIFLFYLVFESSLIPMFFIIGIWGGPGRVYASFKFFLYTLLGSLLMLLAIIVLYYISSGTTFAHLLAHPIDPSVQTWLFLAFLASFSIKLPMFPVHTWLPDAHVEAPTAGSMILAAILLKMGGYGFLRFCLPLFPQASHSFTPLIFALSITAIIYASLVALVQKDMKKLVAYSSIAHMGFVTMGLFAGTFTAVQGSIFIMINHGLVSAAMFLCVGTLYDRTHTRLIETYGGVARPMPLFAVCFLILTMANIGLPGTSGFVGEFLSIVGTFPVSALAATLAALGVVLSAAYALYLYRRVAFSKLENESLFTLQDLTWREGFIFFALIISIIFLGFYPSPALNLSQATVKSLLMNYTH